VVELLGAIGLLEVLELVVGAVFVLVSAPSITIVIPIHYEVALNIASRI
jgi:hypothetical protein